MLTFHDCEYRQTRRIRSYVDVGANHVDVHLICADFEKKYVDVLQETPEDVSTYQVTEVDALTQKSYF